MALVQVDEEEFRSFIKSHPLELVKAWSGVTDSWDYFVPGGRWPDGVVASIHQKPSEPLGFYVRQETSQKITSF